MFTFATAGVLLPLTWVLALLDDREMDPQEDKWPPMDRCTRSFKFMVPLA
jgi:hypothetical protein